MVSNKNKSTTSSGTPERPTIREAIDVIKQSKAKPLFMAMGTAQEINERLKRQGKKKLTIVVLG